MICVVLVLQGRTAGVICVPSIPSIREKPRAESHHVRKFTNRPRGENDLRGENEAGFTRLFGGREGLDGGERKVLPRTTAMAATKLWNFPTSPRSRHTVETYNGNRRNKIEDLSRRFTQKSQQ